MFGQRPAEDVGWERTTVGAASQHVEGDHHFFEGGAISCTVRNFSDSGASLEVASPIGIPDSIVLEFEGGERRCRVIWRKEKRIGVRFADRKDKPDPMS